VKHFRPELTKQRQQPEKAGKRRFPSWKSQSMDPYSSLPEFFTDRAIVRHADHYLLFKVIRHVCKHKLFHLLFRTTDVEARDEVRHTNSR
jgi:hypothetical protein